MKLYVGYLSERATQRDVETFFGRFSKHHTGIHIVVKELKNGERVRYGWAEFSADGIAAKAIRRLNGEYLTGLPVVVREFIERSAHNERRSVDWRSRPWERRERRDNDRRSYDPPQRRNRPEQVLPGVRRADPEEVAEWVGQLSLVPKPE